MSDEVIEILVKVQAELTRVKLQVTVQQQRDSARIERLEREVLSVKRERDEAQFLLGVCRNELTSVMAHLPTVKQEPRAPTKRKLFAEFDDEQTPQKK